MTKFKLLQILLLYLSFSNSTRAAPVTFPEEQILVVRTGNFAPTDTATKNDAMEFIDGVKNEALMKAVEGGPSAKTVASEGKFHLDLQQGWNKDGAHKFAVQLKEPVKVTGTSGKSSTIAQVVSHKTSHMPGTITDIKAKKLLKTSLKFGKEVQLFHPKSKKMDKVQTMQKQQIDKANRISDAYRDGMSRAASGKFRKGNPKGVPPVTRIKAKDRKTAQLNKDPKPSQKNPKDMDKIVTAYTNGMAKAFNKKLGKSNLNSASSIAKKNPKQNPTRSKSGKLEGNKG
ncbi:hypothetical protein BDQ17DRAFT_1287959 [Cyathus striatus]|nr:hypothetical protein BDQ17DRAFT_1287959 [Cyathus striatus]